ncbi:MAG: hypothetical protein NTY19_38500 [Planctomycetota bacterium]|nr:hypothetical protein [Planctomycetota bacterium]
MLGLLHWRSLGGKTAGFVSTVGGQGSLQCGPKGGFSDIEQQDGPVRMSGLRVALITRRFWPLMEDIERTLARLATGLRRRGAEVTILTCRGSADWPEWVDYQSTPVFRLPHPHRERWRTLCYLLAIDRWPRPVH